jgi:3',5'-cyclic-nucleotide phosphodiesterase
MTVLHIIDGHDKRGSLEFSGDSLIVGRSADADVPVKDRFVSRKHLKISRKGRKFFIEDLNSRNGTFVNGEPIHPGAEVELPEGVPVVIGMTVLCLGEGCSEEIRDFLGSIDVSGIETEEPDALSEDRPMTAQRNMELMIKVSDLLTRSTDIHDTLKEILDCIFDLLVRIDRAALILLDPEKGGIKEVIYRMREGVEDQRFSTEVLDHVMQLKEAFMISDADTEEEEDVPDTLKLLHIKSVMCVPLMNRAKLSGFLYVDSITKPHGFRGEDLHLLSAVSSPVAIAIENALLHSRQIEMGGG